MLINNELEKIREHVIKNKKLNPTIYTNLIRWCSIQEKVSNFNNSSPAIIMTLIDLCYRYNLNPIQNDVYLLPLKYGEPPQIFIAYDALYRIALQSQKLEYWDVKEDWDINDPTNLIKVSITVKRTDMTQPTTLSYLMNEWKKDTSKTNSNSPWNKSPAFMLRKCAIARTFSLLFQDMFSGINFYTDAEAWTKEQENEIYKQKELVKIESEK